MKKVIEMKKILNINIIMALATVAVIGYIMSLFYPLYQFHTFNKQVRYDIELYNGDFNAIFTLADLNIYRDGDGGSIQGGKLTVLAGDNFTDQKNYTLEIRLDDRVAICDYTFTYSDGEHEYPIEMLEDATLLPSVGRVVATVYDESNQAVASEVLTMTPARLINGYNKTMRLEKVTLSPRYMRLGQLVTTLDLSGYDSIALEYRYLTSDDLDPADNNSYTVFEKIEGTPEQMLAGTDYGIYRFTNAQRDIPLRPLSVAVVMKSGDTSTVVKIDLD